MASLIITKSSGSKQCILLERDATVIGREPICDVVLTDSSVSRRHAIISNREGRLWIEDLGSKNGTLLNGKPIQRTELTTDAVIDFGNVRAAFTTADRIGDPLTQVIQEETIIAQPADLRIGPVDLSFLTELAEATATSEDPREMAETTMAVLQKILDCENVHLGIGDPRTGEIRHHYHRRQPESDGTFAYSQAIVDKALAQRAPVLVRDAAGSGDWRKQASVINGNIRSVLCVPLIAAGRVEGVVYADTRRRVRDFTADNLTLVSALAPLLGAIFRNLQTMHSLRRQSGRAPEASAELLLIGKHRAIVHVRQTLAKFASKGNAPVLIQGESGTGKELAARMVHHLSSRATLPFLEVNCAAVPHELMESELFGHVKGAFTSAVSNRRGLFELAANGTLLLDEIGEMPLDLQAKLLRVLETGVYRPVGAEVEKRVHARIVAATNRNLRQMVEDGKFRGDLFFRLNVLFVQMPALREHREDIPSLANHFLKSLSEKISTGVTVIGPAAMDLLVAHAWPGNARELKNVIERALYACEGHTLLPQDLVGLHGDEASATTDGPADRLSILENQLQEAERESIRQVLERHRWNRTHAARELGISRKTLIAKIKKFEL